MAGKTKIEWTDATWNPIRGCGRISAGCMRCYAEVQASRIIRMDRGRGIPEGAGSYDGLIDHTSQGPKWNGTIKLVPQALNQPSRWRKPQMIFVNSMSDLFHESVSDDFIDLVFANMALAPHHIFQVLTKRADRMQSYCSDLGASARIFRLAHEALAATSSRRKVVPALTWPLPHVWMGISGENHEQMSKRIPLLLKTPSAVRWISAEPLLGAADISQWIGVRRRGPGDHWEAAGVNQGIDWCVAGGESGEDARLMHPQWPRTLRNQCAAAGIPFLFKQWGQWMPAASDDWLYKMNAAEQAAFRRRYRRAGYEFPNIERRGILPDGRTFRSASQLESDSLPPLVEGPLHPELQWMYAVGKSNSGRLLDGILYDNYPAPKPCET